MEKERRVKALSIVALLIAIAGLTIAFAAMSRLLTINGTASVGKFDVHFATNSEFHGQGQIYEFTGTDGVTDATIAAGEDGTAEILDGITVNNLKAQFDRTGDDSKATFKLYIVNDSNRIAYVNSITYGSDCNSSNSIQCSLKDENGDAISTSTSISAHGNMFVFLEVVAPDSVGSNTTDNNYNMNVQVTFSQDPVSEQSSGNNPVIVDDGDTRYNISFKDFSSQNFDSLNVINETYWVLLVKDINNVIGYIEFAKENNSFPGSYRIGIIPNISDPSSSYRSVSRDWQWQYGDASTDHYAQAENPPSDFLNCKILSENEALEIMGSLGDTEYMTDTIMNSFLNITEV